jgi:hypothetical protein
LAINQWMALWQSAVSSIGALQPIHKCWPGLGGKQERKGALDGSDQPWDVGSIDGACIPPVECKCYTIFPLEERSYVRCVDLLDQKHVIPTCIVSPSHAPSFSGTLPGFHMSRKIMLNGLSHQVKYRGTSGLPDSYDLLGSMWHTPRLH